MSRVESSSQSRSVTRLDTQEQSVPGDSHGDAKQALHQASREALRPRDQSAAGTVAAYMNTNNIATINLDQLKDLSHDKSAPPKVREAAATLVKDRAAWTAIETHDVKGADNLSGVGNFEAAAQGLVTKPHTPPPAPKPLNAKDEAAAGTVAAYMHSNNINVINLDQLKALSHDKTAPKEVREAAATLVKDRGAWRAIETNDTGHKHADNISGVGNFDAAAQGLVNKQPPQGHEPRPHDAPAPKPESKGDDKLRPETEKQAGVLAAYMNSTGTATVDPDKLYALANNTSGDVPKEVQQAAKYMLQHPNEYKKIETHDVAGADGISGVGNFEAAAQGLIGKKAPPPPEPKMLGERADKEAGVMAAYMHEHGMGAIDVNGLYALANDKSAPKEVRQAAEFFLKHPKVYEAIETHDVAGADGISGVGNFDAAAQGQVTRAPNLTPKPVEGTPGPTTNPPSQDDVNKATDTMAKYFTQIGQAPQSPEEYQSQLQDLASNKSGNVPQEVQDAAKTILQSVNTVSTEPAPEVKAAMSKLSEFFAQSGYTPGDDAEFTQALQVLASGQASDVPDDVKAAAQTVLKAMGVGETAPVSEAPQLPPELQAAMSTVSDFFKQAGYQPGSDAELMQALQALTSDQATDVPADVKSAAQTVLQAMNQPMMQVPKETAQPQDDNGDNGANQS